MHENVHMSGNDAMQYVSMCNSLWNVEFASTCMCGTMGKIHWQSSISNRLFTVLWQFQDNRRIAQHGISNSMHSHGIHIGWVYRCCAVDARIICPNVDCSNSTNGIFSMNALVTLTFTHHLFSLRCWLSLLFPYDFRFQFKLWQMKRNFNSFENWIVHSNAWKSAVQFYSTFFSFTLNEKRITN